MDVLLSVENTKVAALTKTDTWKTKNPLVVWLHITKVFLLPTLTSTQSVSFDLFYLISFDVKSMNAEYSEKKKTAHKPAEYIQHQEFHKGAHRTAKWLFNFKWNCFRLDCAGLSSCALVCGKKRMGGRRKGGCILCVCLNPASHASERRSECRLCPPEQSLCSGVMWV